MTTEAPEWARDEARRLAEQIEAGMKEHGVVTTAHYEVGIPLIAAALVKAEARGCHGTGYQPGSPPPGEPAQRCPCRAEGIEEAAKVAQPHCQHGTSIALMILALKEPK